MISSRKSIPKNVVSIGKTNKTIWTQQRSSSHLRIVNPDKSTTCNPLTRIKKLVDELVKVEGCKRVKAIATSFPDIHWIDFEIELEDAELSDETWNKIQDMVIDREWKLIDDSAQEWYFRPQIVDRFYLFGDEVIADSENKKQTKNIRLKQYSSKGSQFVQC
ncbi:MAG: hypothetical protein WBA41_23180 [Rivularia sp. (in: cyanobacteria)]